MSQPLIQKIHYNYFTYGKTVKFDEAEVGKKDVVKIGLHEICTRATIYFNDGTIIITNNVNQVWAKASKEEGYVVEG